MAILPVRYAVVSNNIDASLPAQLGNKVSSVKLSQHKYALRTLRAGYIYLFHEKHARGSHIKWEVYSVSEAGTVWKQISPAAMEPVEAEPACSGSGHNIPASVITIESPEKCKRVWIAFSEHAWSDKTFEAFEQDSKLRDRRMQTFLPATWIAAGGYSHGLPATQANIETVLEYQPTFKPEKINGRTVPTISDPSGVHKPAQLLIQTTRYRAVARNGQSEPLAKLMAEIGKNSKGKDHPPVLMAIWDAVGIVHELNGFRSDTAGWVEKYNAERDQQISAMMAIDGLKQALSKRAADEVDDYQKRVIKDSARYGDLAVRRVNAAKLPADRRAGELEVTDILEDWQRRRVPADIFRMRLEDANRAKEPLRSQKIAQLQKDVDQFLAERAENADRNVDRARSGSWKIYEKQLADSRKPGKKLYQEFEDNYKNFLSAVDKLLNERTIDLVGWLESKSLLDALSEFHPEKESDGIVFDEQIGKAMIGINSSPAGRDKIDAWVKELKATEHNLIWRAIALNQTKIISNVEEFLALAKQHHIQETPSGKIDWITTFSKSLKALADAHKKFASMNTSNTDAGSDKGSKAFGIKLKPINTRGSDLVMMTVGNRIFGEFRVFGLADHASERMIQHLFTIRALMEPIDSLNLIRVQAANEPAVRQQTLQNLRNAKQLLANGTPAAQTKQAESLRAGWKEFNKTNAKAPSAVRDARLALLVMLIEGVTFGKLLTDCVSKNDAKSWWSLVASGMTISSAMFDLASVPVKALAPGLGDSWSYQRLKLYGGVLSAGAAAVTVVLDAQAAKKKYEEGSNILFGLYLFKIGFGVANVAVVAATTFTYAAPLIARLTGKVGLSTAVRVVGNRAAAIVATRVLFMAVGGWITVISFGIQILIWVFNKNDLEIWCGLCIFGISSNADAAYKDSAQQIAELEKVLVNMGMKPQEEATIEEPKKPVYPTREEMMNHD